MKLWPHQDYADNEVSRLIDSDVRSICVASPTGGGKSLLQQLQIEHAQACHERVAHYSNRRWLLEQTSGKLLSHGIQHGIRMSGHDPQLLQDVQLCSVQTEAARVYKNKRWTLHDAHRAIVDEAHLHTTGTSLKIINDHKAAGAAVIGYTATPLELSHCYDELVVAGVNSELRKCKAHLPCHVYGCGELDASKVKRVASGEFSLNEIRKTVWNQRVIGPIIEHHRRLNPDLEPSIGFAPGVQESIWLAGEYTKAGINAAHIDGNDCWVNGEFYKSDQGARDYIVEQWEAGEIKIVWNRFVMREGLDFPWLKHLVLATPIGSLLSYLQVVGRVLRYWPEYDHVIVQDHGGNFWRHGSPNEDRDWHSLWKMKTKTITDLRLSQMREGTEAMPNECPKCGAIRGGDRKCWKCGFASQVKTRMVIQADGSLKPLTVGELRPRRRKRKPGDDAKWKKYYYRGVNKNMTFTQIEALWARENYWSWPERSLPMMPKNDVDWFRKVKDVPKGDLL